LFKGNILWGSFLWLISCWLCWLLLKRFICLSSNSFKVNWYFSRSYLYLNSNSLFLSLKDYTSAKVNTNTDKILSLSILLIFYYIIDELKCSRWFFNSAVNNWCLSSFIISSLDYCSFRRVILLVLKIMIWELRSLIYLADL